MGGRRCDFCLTDYEDVNESYVCERKCLDKWEEQRLEEQKSCAREKLRLANIRKKSLSKPASTFKLPYNWFIETAINSICNSEYKDETICMDGPYDETIGEWTKNPRTEEYMEMIRQRHPNWKLELKQLDDLHKPWYLFVTKP